MLAPAVAPRGSAAIAAWTLRASVGLWFATAAVGQLLFAGYIALFYGRAAASGEYSAWDKVLTHGVRDGDALGNVALATHLLLAFVLTVGGLAQLIPSARRRAPAVHRWLGRAYMISALLVSIGGLYLIWVRGAPSAGGPLNWTALSLNGLLIVLFAVQAWRRARERNIKLHRIWALRLFMAASGVWFLRLGVMLWLLLNGGPAGLGEHLQGPVGVALTFAQYLVPLALLELYLRAQTSRYAAARLATSLVLVFMSIVTAAGAAMAARMLWFPNMQ